MVVIRRTVRASSVPVALSDNTVSYLLDANVAAVPRISRAALDDTDAMMVASKRHDQQLLSDINARLANASFNQPIVVRRSTVTSYSSPQHKPPLPIGRPLAPPMRRYLVAEHDDEEELTMPSTPVTTSVIRSSSVPPRLPTLPPRSGLSATTHHRVTRVDSHMVPPEVHMEYGVPVYGKVVTGIHEPHSTNHPSFSLSSAAYVSSDTPITVSMTPVADLAIRQAHRNLDRINKEIKFTSGHPDGPHTFSSTTYVAGVQPVVARRYTARVPSTYTGSTVVRRTSSVSPSRTSFQYHRALSPSPSDLLLISSMSPPPPPLPAHSHTVLPYDLKTHHKKVDLLTSSMVEAESPLLYANVYKQRIEPVIPYTAHAYTAHVAPVSVSTRVTANVIATPVVTSRGKETTDYVPLPQPISVRPKVSETRRKVREVLCKIRKDPHYFD